MNICSRIAVVEVVLLGTLVACGGNGADEASSLQAPAESPRLFTDPSTSGPRLDVFDVDGSIAISVGGPIGTEGEVLPRLSYDSSLVELYRSLHPEELEVPSDLEALDELVAPMLTALAESVRAEAPPAASGDVVRVVKSQSTFNSTVCKTFTEGSSRYTPVKCNWAANVNFVTASGDQSVQAGDRVYGWNGVNSEAQIKFFPCLEGCNPSGTITLPPFWWTWASMSSGGPYAADLHPMTWVQNPGGERGATHHSLSFIIR